jgi:UTP--glucose-1-phosphate uridylyltransferase
MASSPHNCMLRPPVAGAPFDSDLFARLCDALIRGDLDPEHARLARPPAPLADGGPLFDLTVLSAADRARLRVRGEQALRAGEVAALVLNGGMATRFGGAVKGVVPVVPGRPDLSFLAVKLAGLRSADVPVVLMQSFATAAATAEHLAAIDWAGVPPANRVEFLQSILPRVLPDGTPLPVLPDADRLRDTQLYAAAGHGDSLRRLRESGTADLLAARGVVHLLVSNVDNLGAALDSTVLGAHLEALDRGHAMSVEAVLRQPGDAGGCVADVDGHAVIVEGFRLPARTDLADYPHFNTNTLWIPLSVLRADHPLRWFAVRRAIPWPDGGTREVIQFEQLIGQLSEFVPTACLLVDRTRFLPIKTREDLTRAAPQLVALTRAAGLRA